MIAAHEEVLHALHPIMHRTAFRTVLFCPQYKQYVASCDAHHTWVYVCATSTIKYQVLVTDVHHFELGL